MRRLLPIVVMALLVVGEEAIGEAARGRTDIETDLFCYIDAELAQGFLELQPTLAHVGIFRFDLDLCISDHLSARLVSELAVDEHIARDDGALGRRARREKLSSDQQQIQTLFGNHSDYSLTILLPVHYHLCEKGEDQPLRMI